MSKSNRIGITLRFKQSELRIIQAVLYKLAGHTDIKKGLKDMIVNVVNKVLEEVNRENEEARKVAENSKGEADEQGDAGDATVDMGKAQEFENIDSPILADEKDSLDTDGQSRTGTDV